MVDGSLGEAIRGPEVVGAPARGGGATPTAAMTTDIDEVDAARAQEYALLSVLLAVVPNVGPVVFGVVFAVGLLIPARKFSKPGPGPTPG